MSETVHIRIGNQSAFTAETVTTSFEYAVANDFDAFEWLPDKKESGAGWEEGDIDAKTRRYIKNTALGHDIHLSVHAPWHVDPSEADQRERLPKAIDFARDIGASLLNVHLYTDHGIDAYIQGILPFTKPLAQVGIGLSIENTPLTGPEDFNAFFAKLRHLACPAMAHVGMCLDLGHANLCEATRNDYLRFIDLLDTQVPIIHVHMHENYGDYDSHLTIFTGPAGEDVSGVKGFIKRMKDRGFSGSIILEQWPKPPSLLNEARNRLREIIGNSARPLCCLSETLLQPPTSWDRLRG